MIMLQSYHYTTFFETPKNRISGLTQIRSFLLPAFMKTPNPINPQFPKSRLQVLNILENLSVDFKRLRSDLDFAINRKETRLNDMSK